MSSLFLTDLESRLRLAREMRKAASSRVFPLFSSATSTSSKSFFIEKIYLGKKASFHLIVRAEKNTKTQVIRAFKEESHNMAILNLAFNMT